MSWSAEDSDEGPQMVIRFFDPDSLELESEFRYDNPERLGGTSYGFGTAGTVLAEMIEKGFDEVVDESDLEMAMSPIDLTDVELTVDMIISGGECPEES